MQVPFYSADDTRRVVSPSEAVEAVRSAYLERGELGDGAPAEPRTKLVNRDPPGIYTAYLAVLPRTGYMGTYAYSGGFGSGDAWFVFALHDADTGEPVALFDGSAMNPLKTGAVSAVGTDELARENATTFAFFGAGLQARWSARSVEAVRDLGEIVVYTPSDSAEEFVSWAREELGVDARAARTPADAVRSADVVTTATDAAEPVFDGDDLKDGAHVTAMGAYDPEKREIDATTVALSKYVLDLRARANHDAGAFIQAVEEGGVDDDGVHAELGEVVAGDAGREGNENTVFDSGGTAVETTAVAALLHENADASGEVEFAPLSDERRRA